MVVFGALTDFLLLACLGQWVMTGGSWRFIIALSLTYSLRCLFSSLFKMRGPEKGDLWEFPGWYSLVVNYGNQNDYYFNPAVAVAT